MFLLAISSPVSYVSDRNVRPDASFFTISFPMTTIQLPSPDLDGRVSVEKTLATRRSVRDFENEPMSLAALAQLCWAAQGVTRKEDVPPGWSWGNWQGGRRTAPSAGAMYPLELYVIAGSVEGLDPGVYKYKPLSHELLHVTAGDKRSQMVTRGPGQKWMAEAPCLFVVAGTSRLDARFGERAARYLHFEVGHVVENICLQSVALEFGSTVVGSFVEDTVKQVLGMPADQTPLAIVPVGKWK